MKLTENEKYKAYCNTAVRDVPSEHLKVLINLFVDYSALNLGVNTDKANVDRLVELVRGGEFNLLPISVIASGFIRGSLGKLKNDNTKLSPRNIYEWLTEVSIEYRNKLDHLERQKSPPGVAFNLKKYPLGQALLRKIDWFRSGAITEADWEKIPLKELAEMIGRGEYPTIKDFNIRH